MAPWDPPPHVRAPPLSDPLLYNLIMILFGPLAHNAATPCFLSLSFQLLDSVPKRMLCNTKLCAVNNRRKSKCTARLVSAVVCSSDGLVADWVGTTGVEMRFEGSEELGYDPLGTPPRGEICLRGPIVFDGYYQDKEKTKEAFGACLPSLHVHLPCKWCGIVHGTPVLQLCSSIGLCPKDECIIFCLPCL